MTGARLFSLLLLISVVLVTAEASITATDDRLEGYTFSQYLTDFKKRYSAGEYRVRRRIFDENLAAIKAHNAAGTHSYVRGVNHMTDWTPAELSSLNGARPRSMSRLRNRNLQTEYTRMHKTLPFEVDYRSRVPPVLTAVKNQGQCGSCWAHSAAEAMESHWAIATGHLHVLSQQQLTSCTPNPRSCGGTGGCFGAIESLAFEYVHEAGGLAEEWWYPYTSYHGSTGTCLNVSSSAKVVEVTGYVKLPSNEQYALMEAVAFNGPIAVSVDASEWSSYAGGIFDGCDYARNITQNHAVQLVGYGHDVHSKRDYWIIRNSWGPRWGENGYMRLLRHKTPECGWDVDAHSGSACDGDPDTQWVCGMCGILSDSTFPIMKTR